MNDDHIPPHAVYIRWRTFQAGIFGLPAIISVSVIAAALLLTYVLRLW